MRKINCYIFLLILPIFCLGQKDSAAKWIVGEWRYTINLSNEPSTERIIVYESPLSKMKVEHKWRKTAYKKWGYYYYIFKSDGSVVQGKVEPKKYSYDNWEINGNWSLSEDGQYVSITNIKTIKKERNESAIYSYAVKGYKLKIEWLYPCCWMNICDGFLCVDQLKPVYYMEYVRVK